MSANVLVCCCMALLLIAVSSCSNEPAKTTEEQFQASAADMRNTLRKTVTDDSRLRKMLALIDRADADMQSGAREFKKVREQQQRLNADYDTTRDELQQIGDKIQAVRKTYRDRVISVRQELAQLATNDEWKSITSRDLAIFGN